MTPTVAAVVVEYRSPAYTVSCVEALLRQHVDSLVIVDNSNDQGATFAILESKFHNDARVNLLDAGANLGFAAGVNLGIRYVRRNTPAMHVLVINNDAVPGEGLVFRLAETLRQDERRLIAYPSLLHAGTAMGEVYYHRWLATIGSRPAAGAFRIPRGCCMMIATNRLPGPLFDESFFMYGEEIALGWQLRRQPHALCHVADVVAIHEGSVAAGLGSIFYEERTAAAHLLLSHRLSRNRYETIFLVFVRTPVVVSRALWRAMRLRSLRPLKALYPAFVIARSSRQTQLRANRSLW